MDPQRPGARNMAVDAALLQLVDQSPPTLRLYGFAPACLSVGRFQPLSDVATTAAAQRAVDMVRRPTGGKAVLHDHEVTYAMVLGRHQLQPFSKRGAFRVAADLLLRVLEALGVSASTGTGVDTPARSADPNCFLTTASFEIVASGRKLVGSAQTTTRRGSLQHGSLPLSGSYRSIDGLLIRPPSGEHSPAEAEPPTSVEEETGRRWSFLAARDALASRLTQGDVAEWVTGVRLGTLTADEERAAARLEQEQFGNRAWTERSRQTVSG